MYKRIIELRKLLNLSQTEFAEKIGVARTTISGIEQNKATITERTILTICTIYNVNENWLRFGQGEIFKTYDILYNNFFDIFKNLNPILQDYLLETTKKLLDIQDKL